MTRFEIDYTKSDMTAFFNETAKKPLVKRLVWMYSVIGITIFFVFLAATYFVSGSISFAKPLPFIFLGVLIILVALAITRTIRTTPEKMYNSFTESYDGNTVICRFDDDRVYIESETANNSDNGFIMYSALEKAVESDNYFYIFVNQATAQIIRKSAVTEGTIDEVRSNLRTYLGERYEDIRKYRR